LYFTCRDDGVGLAAPQVGVNVRLMVFNETAERGSPEETVLVNPVIIEKGRATDVDVEGCLSFPKIYADVEVGGVQIFVVASGTACVMYNSVVAWEGVCAAEVP
jgi:hypothetical protein